MEIGLTGKPNSGKSSFFKAATMIDVEIASHPFTTIKPNVGIGYVVVDCVEKKYGVKCKPNHGKCENGKRYIPVKLWDIAGIVPDAHLGKGLGLQFLDDIRQTSVLIQIVDVSGLTDSEGKPTTNYNPSQEIAFVEREIDSWFTGIVRKGLEKYKQKIRKVNVLDILTEQLSGLGISKEQINETMEKFGLENIEKFAFELRKLSKPIIIAANKIDLENSELNLEKIKREFPHLTIIPTSAAAEIALKTAHQKGLIEYTENDFIIKDETKLDKKQIDGLNLIKEKVLKKYGSTGIQDCLNKAIFDVLDFIVVYPVADINKLSDKKGNILPDAFLVKKGTTLREFAFMIHTDIGEKFIGGMDAKTKRKLGADYELKNDDIIEILFQH